MATQIKLSDAFGAYERGAEVGRADKENRRQEELKTLAPQIMAGDEAAYTRGAQIDQKAAQGYQDEHTKKLKQLRAAAQYMKDKLDTGDEVAIQAAWSSGVRPFLAKLVPGKEVPEQWDKAQVPAIEQALAMTAFIDEEDKAGNRVQSTKVGEDGYYYTVDRNGNWQKSDVKANPNIQVIEQEGNTPFGVVKSGGVAGSVVPIGAGGTPAPAAGPTGAPRAASGAENTGLAEKLQAYTDMLVQSGLTPEQIIPLQDAYEKALGVQSTPEMAAGDTPAAAAAPAAGPIRTPTSAEKKIAETAGTGTMGTLTPEQVVAEGLPPGTFAQRNTLTGEIKVGPAAAQTEPGSMTAAQREKLRVSANKAKTAVKGTSDELERMRKAVQLLKNNEEGLKRITGLYSMLPNIPGSKAANAQADLDALKSQIGFAVLQKMRQNSPTGGALGNVSDKEGARLEQNLASLDNAQSYEQMVERLDQIISYVDESKSLLQTAYDEQFGEAEAGEAPATSGTVWTRDASGKLVRGD